MGPAGPAGEPGKNGQDGKDGQDGEPGETVILGQGFREAIEWINEVDEEGVTVRKGRFSTDDGATWPDESTATTINNTRKREFADSASKYYIKNPDATKEDYIENNKKENSWWITFTFPISNVRGA